MTTTATRFTIRVTRDLDGLRRLAGWVNRVTDALSLSASESFALRLCVEEATANLVMHGVPTTDADTICIELEPGSDGPHLAIEDTCVPFDPRDAPAPPPLTDDARIGGLGVHLLRQHARNIAYTTVAGVNRLTLTTGGL
jgi:anti-sigma regulatory factor (Ser/Thr protein kinase)